MPKHCSYAMCNSDSRYPRKGIFFIRFPKPWIDLEKCKRWIQACKREDFSVKNIKNYTYICSLHFVGRQGPTTLNPDPISATSLSTFIDDRSTKSRKRNSLSVPSGGSDVKQRKIESDKEDIGNDDSELSGQAPEDTKNGTVNIITPLVSTAENLKSNDDEYIILCSRGCQVGNSFTTTEKTTQTCLEVENIYIKKLKNKIQYLKNQLKVGAVTFENFNITNKKFKFYTGLTLQQFDVLWNFLDENKNHLKIWDGKEDKNNNWKCNTMSKKKISPQDQLLICLMRLSGGFLEQDIAYRFNVSQSFVSKIIITWIQYLSNYFLQVDIFPSRDRILKNPRPKIFKKFKNLRIIIDCFEITTQKPSDYREQGNMYSSYKAHSTFKFLLAIIPTGGICFVSDAFEGSISDRDIFVKSGLFEKLDHGDSIMVDKGFNVQDLCNEKNIKVFIPPFLKDRQQLTKEEVQLTKDIASARIHVERAVGAMKRFRLLQKLLPKTLIPIVSQMVFVVASLVNLQEPLVT